jgi:hypothetical protein
LAISDNLALVAELAIGLAGFASLVAVVGHRQGRDSRELDVARLRSMLEMSLLVACFALIPHIPHQAGLSEALVWQSCSGLFAVVAAAFTIYGIRRLILSLPRHDLNYPWHVFWVGLSASAVISLGVAALGLLAPTSAYLWGLYVYLTIAALIFLRLVRSLLEGPA